MIELMFIIFLMSIITAAVTVPLAMIGYGLDQASKKSL